MAKARIVSHVKIIRLARQLGTVPGVAVGLMETFWQWIAEHREDGGLSLMDFEDAVDAGGFLSMWPAEQILAAMSNAERECVLIDRLEDGRLYVHNWHEHANDSVKLRLARAGRYFANGLKPSISKLSKEERERIDALYEHTEKQESEQQAHDVRTESAPPKPKPIPEPKPEDPPTPQGEKGFDPRKVLLPPNMAGPEGVEVWDRWVTHRSEIKKKLTREAVKEQLVELSHCRDPVSVVKRAIAGGWTGLNAKPEDKTASTNGQPTHTEIIKEELTRLAGTHGRS